MNKKVKHIIKRKEPEINKLLRELMISNTESKNTSKIEAELRYKIPDPGFIEKSDLVSENNPIKLEARIITDAFESVTNGMYNPEALELLKSLPENSVFSIWRDIIYALYYYYQNKPDKVQEILDKVPKNTPPSLLSPVLQYLSDSNQHKPVTKLEKSLISKIREDSSFFKEAQSQLQECLDRSYEDLYLDTASLLIKDTYTQNTNAAQKLSIWCLKTASEYNFSLTPLLNNIKIIMGTPEGLRLTAIALLSEDPDISVLFWIRSLICLLKERNIDKEKLGGYLTIIAETVEAVFEIYESFNDFLDSDFFEGFHALLNLLNQELKILFTDQFGGLLNRKLDKSYIYMLAAKILPTKENLRRVKLKKKDRVKPVKVINRSDYKKRQKQRIKTPLQYELF